MSLQKYLDQNGVQVIYDARVEGFEMFEMEDEKIKSVELENRIILAEKFVIATGGKSYPATGSTGDGYAWAEKFGHKIIRTAPALVPVRTAEEWAKEAQGLSLKNVEIKIFQNNKKQDSRFGEMLFTHFGVSGPIVLDISKKTGELLEKGEVVLSIDLKPVLAPEQLDARLQRDFQENLNKNFKNYLPDLLPQKLIDIIINLSDIDPDKKINFITKDERKKLIHFLKDLRLTVSGTTGYNQAIVTSGGVDIHEVDSKTMRSRLIDNLYFAGEILDLDGPTGGYNLQMCWSTGRAAGTYVVN